MKRYLLLDSSFDYLFIGISSESNIIDFINRYCYQQQSEFMISEIDNILKKNNLTMQEISGIVVSVGPGSYTGIRIALTVAKVAAFALKIPLYPVSSLAINQDFTKQCIVLFNAHSNRSYFASFDNGKYLVKDCVKENKEVIKYINDHPNFLLIGNLDYLNLTGTQITPCDNMVKLISLTKPIMDPEKVKPVYLKELY